MKRQNKLKLSVLAITIVMMIICFAMPVNASKVFSDLYPDHWCYNKIIDFEEKGYVCGYEDGTFRADQTITRAEYAKIVNNFVEHEMPKTWTDSVDEKNNTSFKDVSVDDWFYPYVKDAALRGFMEGDQGDNTFRPHDSITRQEATVILARVLDIDEEPHPADHEDGLAQYPDGDEVEDWARVAIHSYSVYNFINGYEDGFLRILQDVTRAETVELLHILEQNIIRPDDNNDKPKPKPDPDPKPGGSHGVTAPAITVYEMSGDGRNEEMVVASGWVNYDTAYEDVSANKLGALVEITCSASNSTITYTLDNWATRSQYTDKFVLTDGIYTIKAYASKTNYADSDVVAGTAKVDTVAPEVTGVQVGKEVTLTVTDSLSGVSGESLKYAWFTSGDNGDYVRETLWNTFINGETVVAPDYPGVYYLGVMGSDVAENKIGTGFSANEPNVNNDDNVDYPGTQGKDDDEKTNEPFVIVTEIENDDPTGGDPTSSGDKETIIEIVVNSMVTVVHDFDDNRSDLDPSGDITTYLEAKPGEEFTVDALNSGDAAYAFVKNYKVVEAPKTINVSRNSGDNNATIEYKRIKVTVEFNKNADDAIGTTDPMVDIPAGTSENLPANGFTRVGYEFAGWSGDNGKIYDNEEEFTADSADEEVTLYAKWNVLSYTVTLISGDNVSEVTGAGEYEYGSEVAINAVIDSRLGYSYAFVWSGDSEGVTGFNKTSANTEFTMPARDLLFEAIATESVNTDTQYKVKHWKEKIEGGYPERAAATDNLSGTTGEIATFTPRTYTGFEYSGDLTTPTDKTILGDGSLVINLFYTRNSYDLEIAAGSNIDSVELNGDASVLEGTFKYGEEIDINAIVKEPDGADYVFAGWYDSDSTIFTDSGDTTIEMPAENITLTAKANKIDVTLSEITIVDFTGSGENGKTAPEPGDEVTYKFTVTNTSDIDDVEIDLLLAVNKSGDIDNPSVSVDFENVNSKEITFTAKIDPNFPVNENFGVTVTAKSDSETANGTTLATKTNNEKTEKLSGINFKQKTNKNIVMLIDLSGSMGFCTTCPECDVNSYYGYALMSGDVNDGTYTGGYDLKDKDTGKKHSFDETIDYLYSSGELIIDYNRAVKVPWRKHSKTLTNSGDTCGAPARIDVLIDALTSDNGFIDTISRGAIINSGEQVTITLVSFSGYSENNNNVAGEEMATVIGTFDIGEDNSTLKKEVEKMKFDIHHGTYINTGLNEVLKLVDSEADKENEYANNRNKLLSDSNVENYFIFFGDGIASDYEDNTTATNYVSERNKILEKLITGSSAYFDYSYAIGFGVDFTEGSDGDKLLDSLLKDGEGSIKATDADSIVEAFANIARKISATAQTENGILTIDGESFDDAVYYDRVFDIIVMNGSDELFVIEETTAHEVDVNWDSDKDGNNDTVTHVTFNYTSGTSPKLKSIDIDLSGTAFSNKKQLNIALDYEKPSND
ncbi:MAG: S-layer homology domain-containing protein [Clostridia bacterium]|nr:S-layer homology domain-containing protein [Clostridia bacterium]